MFVSSPRVLSVISLFCILATMTPDMARSAERPLTGVAWQYADLAYKSYEAGDYAQALTQLDSALMSRPDVARLQLLKVYTLQKLGRIRDARDTAQAAVDAGTGTPALQAALTTLQRELAAAQVPAPVTPPGAPRPVTTDAPGQTVAPASIAATPAAQALPASRPKPVAATPSRSFRIATQAYADYKRGDMPAAAAGAQRAFRLDPKQGAWAMLWLDALRAQGQSEAEAAAIDVALSLGAPNNAELQARRQTLGRERAFDLVSGAYQAIAAGRASDAIGMLRAAVALAPDVSRFRLLLITTLVTDEQLAQAEIAATQALAQDDNDTSARVMRGYVRQRQGNTAASQQDFDLALAQAGGDVAQHRHIRLIAADAALAAGSVARVRTLLQPLDATDTAVERRVHTLRSSRATARLTASNYPAPIQDCRETSDGVQCTLLAYDQLTTQDTPAARAYAAYRQQNYQEAIQQATLAVQQSPTPDMERLYTTTLAAGNNAQAAQAGQRLDAALADDPRNAELLMQRGYLRQRLGQRQEALADIRAARATGNAPPTALMTEGYLLSALGDKPTAVQAFKKSIDLANSGELEWDERQRENVRNDIADMSREWGIVTSSSYRGALPATSNLAGTAISTPGASVYNTAEIFWRPPQTNNRFGMLEAYARVSNTLYNEESTFESIRYVDPCTGAATPDGRSSDERTNRSGTVNGWPSTVGSLGLRYAVADTGINVGLERRFFLGSATREGTLYPKSRSVQCDIQQGFDAPRGINSTTQYKLDDNAGGWMTYVSYGFYRGSRLRTDVPSWLTVEGYAQLGYAWDSNNARFDVKSANADGGNTIASSKGKLKRAQAFATTEVRLGRSFRFFPISDKLVVFPHVVVGADWLWQKQEAEDVDYAGLGSLDYRLSDSGRSWSLGVGPGIAVRHHFREDRYSAPKSYLDFSLQYRFPVGGGDQARAKGLFANMTLFY